MVKEDRQIVYEVLKIADWLFKIKRCKDEMATQWLDIEVAKSDFTKELNSLSQGDDSVVNYYLKFYQVPGSDIKWFAHEASDFAKNAINLIHSLPMIEKEQALEKLVYKFKKKLSKVAKT